MRNGEFKLLLALPAQPQLQTQALRDSPNQLL